MLWGLFSDLIFLADVPFNAEIVIDRLWELVQAVLFDFLVK
jgi:hypothetical protein